MPATVAAFMPDAAYIKACKWFTEAECEVYGQEYTRSGWTGALQEYRRRRNDDFAPTIAEQLTFAGRTIDVPAQAIVARQDWGSNRTVGGPHAASTTGRSTLTASASLSVPRTRFSTISLPSTRRGTRFCRSSTKCGVIARAREPAGAP
jgi:hypothetical protein